MPKYFQFEYLVKPSHGFEVLAMSLWCGASRLKLQAADHVEDRLFAEHDLEERILVQQEDVAEDLIEVVEPLHILQVLREHVRLVDCQNFMRSWGQSTLWKKHLPLRCLSSFYIACNTWFINSQEEDRTKSKQTSQTVKMLRSFLM